MLYDYGTPTKDFKIVFCKEIDDVSLGWVHHSTKSTGSRGCESFQTKEFCTWIEVSGIKTKSMVVDWQLPSDFKDSFDQVTIYPHVMKSSQNYFNFRLT